MYLDTVLIVHKHEPAVHNDDATYRLLVSRGIVQQQLVDAVESGGYEAKVHAVDEEGVAEVDDPEIKAAKVCL